jgi:predicted outer membrane repeat protein
VRFQRNAATDYGGAIYCGEFAGIHLERCRFSDNHASRGGAIYQDRLTGSEIVACEFRNNTSSQRGGAICSAGYSPTNHNGIYAINCIFFHNATSGNGGAIHNVHTNTKLVNCTVAGNEAALGGGVLTGSTSTLTVYNSIVRLNVGGAFGGVGARHVHYSNITGGHAGAGNIDKASRFVDFAEGDLRLLPSAKSIDAGRKYLVPLDVTTDIDDNPRFVDVLGVPNAGTGSPPVDMGAYEFQP